MVEKIDWAALKQPISNIEDIAWKHFGYAFIIVFTSPFIIPLLLIGLIYVELLTENEEISVKSTYKSAVYYTVVFMLYLAIPVLTGLFSISFFIIGYSIEGSLLVLISLAWLLGYAFILPGLLTLVNKYESPTAIIHLREIRYAITQDPTNYAEAAITMAVASIIFLIISVILIWFIIGIIAVPLLILWFIYVSTILQTKVQSQFFEKETEN